MTVFKSPLNLYVIWHPKFARGLDYANFLYSEFSRNCERPLSRGLGIPVYFRSELADSNQPREIDFNAAEKNAVIVLVDDEMFESPIWTQFFRKLAPGIPKNARLFPVAVSKYAYDVAPEIKQQFIRLNVITHAEEKTEFENRCKKLKSELLHDLSRLLLDMVPSNEAANDSSPPPVKLFISHAKKDGENIAIEYRNYIRAETKLSSFFDANDIANGYDFEKEIAGGVKNSALVVFQTDEYSTREWCRIEVITAKRYKSPIVIVNAVKSGEKRSFPYMGNVPSIRWNNNFSDITDLALVQVLYNLHSAKLLIGLIGLYSLKKYDVVEYLTTPPELFNYISIVQLKEKNKKSILIVYPDPPLGIEELRLLNELDRDITFTTPVMLPQLIYT